MPQARFYFFADKVCRGGGKEVGLPSRVLVCSTGYNKKLSYLAAMQISYGAGFKVYINSICFT